MGSTVKQQAAIARFDFADFAQEFLRRNQVYQREHTAIAGFAQQDPTAFVCKEMARFWGLVFPH